MVKLSFVIPCYGSEASLEGVVAEIISTVRSRQGYDYEIVLVNDASPDGVYGVIEALAVKDPKIKGICLAKNFGQHSALMTGFRHTTGDIVVVLDDDGQTPAEELFALVDKVEEGYDLVFAKYYKKQHNYFRNLGSKLNDFMAEKLVGKPKGLAIMSYFAARSFVVEEARNYRNSYPYIYGILLRSTNRVANVMIHHRERAIGASTYTFSKLVSLWLNGFTAFSVLPLRFATLVGTLTAFLGFLYGIWVILERILFMDKNVGYASLMAGILFIGGMVMLMLGMVGEYIGRIYMSINNAPQSVIRSTVNIEEKK